MEIKSEWTGFSPDSPIVTDVFLTRLPGGDYRMTSLARKGNEPWVASTHAVSTEVVDALVQALLAPAQDQMRLADLGVGITKVQHAVDEALSMSAPPPIPQATAQVKRYRQSLRNPAVLARTVARGFDGSHTDDYPFVRVRVVLDDGTVLSASGASLVGPTWPLVSDAVPSLRGRAMAH